MFLTASTTHIRRYNGVPEVRLDLNFRHASPKGTPKTLAQHEVLGTWHSHSWLCVFPPGWKPLEMFLTASTTHIRRYNGVPEVRLNLNFRHASPKGTPKTLAQYEVLGTTPMDDSPEFMKHPANRIATSSQATPGH